MELILLGGVPGPEVSEKDEAVTGVDEHLRGTGSRSGAVGVGASPSRVAISLSNASQNESAKCSVMSLARLSAFSSLSRSPEEAGRRSTASCNSRQSARWRRSAPSRSAADFRALAVCWFIPTSSRLAREHDDLPTVRGLVVAKDVDGTVVPADLEVAVVGAVPAIDDLEHLDAAAAQFEPAWGLLAAVAGVAVDVDVPGHSVPREWAADHAAVL